MGWFTERIRKPVNLDINKANELFLYGKEVMDLPPGQLMTSACFILAMVFKMYINPTLWKEQMDEIRKYIEEDLLVKIDASKVAPFRSED